MEDIEITKSVEPKKSRTKELWRIRNVGKVRFTCELCRYQCLEKFEILLHTKSKEHQERLYPGYVDRCMISHPQIDRQYIIQHSNSKNSDDSQSH